MTYRGGRDCRHIHIFLGVYILGVASERESWWVESHLAHCWPCLSERASLARTAGCLAALTEDDVLALLAES